MIGNDIVDLELAAHQSRWQRRGFLSKLFTGAEQRLILGAADPFCMVWLLWSCKEAVYKIVHRRTLLRTYAPLKFCCVQLRLSATAASGYVLHNGSFYKFRSLLCRDYIHTVAVEEPASFNETAVTILHSEMNDAALAGDGRAIARNAYGVPDLIHLATGRVSPVSISHHGRFSSMVMLPGIS